VGRLPGLQGRRGADHETVNWASPWLWLTLAALFAAFVEVAARYWMSR